MIVRLSDITIRKGERKEFPVRPELSQLHWKNEDLALSCEPFSLFLENLGKDSYRLMADFSATLYMPCSCCLREVPVLLELSEEQVLDVSLTEEERIAQLNEQSYVHGYELDVDEFIRNELFLNIPTRVLCREDCKGLCSRCGADRNLGDCGCEDGPLDPRMAAIQEIFKNANMQG